MIGCKSCETPIEPRQKFDINEEEQGVCKGQCHRLVGKLIYLSHTRPDIAFSKYDQSIYAKSKDISPSISLQSTQVLERKSR